MLNMTKQTLLAAPVPFRVSVLGQSPAAAGEVITMKQTKAERTAKRQVYQQVHKAELAASARAYRETHKPERAANMKAYHLAHKPEIAAYMKKWQKVNGQKCADSSAKRRALKLGATVEKVSRAVVYERDGGRCHICGKKVPKKGWHLDHIVALTNGGEHSYRNVAVSCAKCNQRKHTGPGGQLRLL